MADLNKGMGLLPGRRSLFGVAAVMLLGSARGHAQGIGSTGGQAEDARQRVNDLYKALVAAMRTGGGTSFAQRFNQLAPVIDRVFDLPTILQTSVGLRWSSLNETARQALLTVFRTFTVASYTANFDKDGGERFEVLPETRPSGSDVIVESRLVPSGGDAIRIDYVMRNGPGGWQIVDVLLNGSISRVAVQRSDFRSLLASGDPNALINSLRQKVAELSGGTMRS